MIDGQFNTIEDGIDAICNEHPGAIIDEVRVTIDDCEYSLVLDANNKVNLVLHTMR